MKEQSEKEGITAVDVSRVLQGLLPERKFRFGMIFDSWDLCKSKAKCTSIMRRNVNEIKEFILSLVNGNEMDSNARASPPHREVSTGRQ